MTWTAAVDVGRVSLQGRNPTAEAATKRSGYAALTRSTAGVDEPEGEERWTGSYTVAVKIIDIFGNDTMVPVNVG